MRTVKMLTDKEYTDLIISLTDDEKRAKKICKKFNVDFEDVKEYDWGFEWQIWKATQKNKKNKKKVLTNNKSNDIINT